MQRTLLALAAFVGPCLGAWAHHPEDPTGGLHWWELVGAGAIAVLVLFIGGRIRRRVGRRRAASSTASERQDRSADGS